MARVHRPPPPVPAVEHEEQDNYGVWSDSEFDDPTEIYENTDDPKAEDDSDYEHPDDPAPTNPAARPLPTPAAPAIPPIPPRPGFRPVPSPAALRPEPTRGGAISPRSSPLPPAPVENEEIYEDLDTQSPPIIDDGEVYEVVDDKPVQARPNDVPAIHSLRPVPKPGGGGGGFRAHPPLPVPDFQQKEAPQGKSKQAEIKGAVSPNMPRRDMPMPLPPPVKSTPFGRALPIKRPSPQPSPPPSPPAEVDDMYTGTEFYADAERDSLPPPPFPGGPAKNTKPLPRPPSECDDDNGDTDEFYTEVPEMNLKPRKAVNDRPIPPVPQASQATASSASGIMSRFPVEKLHAELARMAEASKKVSKPEPAADALSGGLLQNAKTQLKSVNRVESLNTPEKPKVVPSVKRTESDNTNRMEAVVKKGDRKVSKISEMMNRFESDEKEPEKQGISLSPMFPRKEPYSSDTSGNRNNDRIKPTLPVPSEAPNKRPAVPKPEPIEVLAPPSIPMQRRASPVRNFKDEANSKEMRSAAESKATANDKRALPKPPTSDELEGLYSYAWYFSDIERSTAEKNILELKQDGAFLVRKSKRGGQGNPYTLTLLYSSFIYNLHIRKRTDQKYALGSEKPDEHVFTSVEDLVSFHRNNPIEVIGDARKNAVPGKVVLKASPKK